MFFIVQRNRLKVNEIKIHYTEDQFQEAVQQTIDELKLLVEINEEKVFRVKNLQNQANHFKLIFKE